MIGQSQRFCKFRKKSFGTCVGMRLEYTPYLLMRIILCSMKGCLDLGWMMRVIINDGDTADLTFILETTVCTGKASETFDDHIIRKVQKASYGNGGQCIGYVVDTRYTQIIATDLFAPEENGEGRMSVFIPGNVCCGVIGIVLQTIGKNIAWKLPGDRLILRCVGVDDQSTVSREKLCKFPEGMADVVNVLEEIQMIGIHVQDHTDLREEA